MKDLGRLWYFLDLEVQTTLEDKYLHQHNYIQDVILWLVLGRKFGSYTLAGEFETAIRKGGASFLSLILTIGWSFNYLTFTRPTFLCCSLG